VHLTELLTALALVGLVFAATVTVLTHGLSAYARGAARVESQQSARVALARIAREIRQAGGGGRLAPIVVAEPARIVIQHDLDGDGAATARGETVTWQLSAGGILRRNAGGGAQPIVNGVRAFALAYLDGDGRSTTVPADVHSVIITLTTEPEHPAAGAATLTRLTTEVHLRNR
jgi:hypothetical protein